MKIPDPLHPNKSRSPGTSSTRMHACSTSLPPKITGITTIDPRVRNPVPIPVPIVPVPLYSQVNLHFPPVCPLSCITYLQILCWLFHFGSLYSNCTYSLSTNKKVYWGPMRLHPALALMLRGGKANNARSRVLRTETRRERVGIDAWLTSGLTFAIRPGLTKALYWHFHIQRYSSLLHISHQFDSAIQIIMATLSGWDITIDNVIRQVQKDIKKTNNQAMKGSIHTVSPSPLRLPNSTKGSETRNISPNA